MIDVSYFQSNTSNTQIFQNGDTWQTWIKPKNAKMVNFFVVGAGAGGGGGYLAATGNKSGGQGGGTGGHVKLTVPASLLPGILYILPGTGGNRGTGGNPATSGGNATKSFVCLTPSTSSTSGIVCTSGNIAAVGGASGSVNAATNSGSAETLALAANMMFANLGSFQATAGIVGGQGALVQVASSTTVTSFMVASTGAGGSNQGGQFTAGGPFPLIPATPVNTDGKNGLIYYKPIFGVSGGQGGGGGTTGGNGGNGAPGCGGGGGGAGTTSAGNGGTGGDGFVIITTNF